MMNIQEDFERSFDEINALLKKQDDTIKQQAAEIAALRGFAKSINGIDFAKSKNVSLLIELTSKNFGLIDTDKNPTSLLTGKL